MNAGVNTYLAFILLKIKVLEINRVYDWKLRVNAGRLAWLHRGLHIKGCESWESVIA